MKAISEEIQRLKKVLEENPQSIQFARLAEYLLRTHQLEEAISVCRKGLENHPTYANGHYILGLCYYEMGDAEEAEAEFNRALLYDPEHLNARHYQARLMKDKEWYNAYILRLKQLLAIDPFDREAREQLEAYEKESLTESLAPETGIPVSEEEESEVEREEFEKVERAFSEAETAVEEGQEEQEEEIAIAEEEFPKETVEETPEEKTEGGEELEKKDYEYILDDIFRDEIGESEVELVEEQEEALPSEEDQSMTERIREAAEAMEEEPPFEESPFAEGVESVSEEEAARAVFESPSEEVEEESGIKIEEEKEPVSAEGEVPATAPEFPEEEESGEKGQEIMMEEPQKEAEVPPPSSEVPSTEESRKKEPIVTSTLGEIYAAQGHFAKAINVYEILLKKDPDNEMYKRKIEELKKKLEEQQENSESQE